jgi:two-component system chemotaxis response regulator CheB
VPTQQISNHRYRRNIVVMGASAGGVEALLKMAGRFPAINASVFLVLHTGPQGYSSLPVLLNRHSRHIRVVAAQDGMAIQGGHMYIAVPNHHLVLERGYMRLVRGPVENRHRPSIDALFRSAARAYGSRVIGVVLSGYLDDGSAGLNSIKRAGGLAVVQSPEDALVASMPESAIGAVQVDYISSAEEIPQLLGRLVREQVEVKDAVMARNEEQKNELVDPKGAPSTYTCPECHGTLWEVEDGDLLRFACRVGHALSIESMLQDQSESAERALWAGLRALEERADLTRRMEQRSRTGGLPQLARRYSELASSAAQDAAVLRRLMMENRPMQSRERHDHDLAETA